MKAIIAGGRDYKPTQQANDWLVKTLQFENVDFELCGGSTGADEFGKQVAQELHMHGKIYPAKWSKYGKKAGPLRNERMACDADICILFPGGRGTEDMKHRAIIHGLKIIEYKEGRY